MKQAPWELPAPPPAPQPVPTAPASKGSANIFGRLALLGIALLLVVLLPIPSSLLQFARPVGAISPYDFPFTAGKPLAPTPWNPSSWDVAVHVRNNYQFGGLDAMQAGHGPSCAPAPATHPVSDYHDAVFFCNNHVMTAMSAGGYGAVYLTPDHMFDWSTGTSILKFPVSTFRTSDRDWIDLWITPFNENLELPLESWLPDLQGPPKDAIHIRMNEFNQGTTFEAEVYSNFQSHALPSNWWTSLESQVTPSAVTRSTFELDLSQSHLRFGIPLMAGGGSMWWVDSAVSLPFTAGVVQLGHHSYTPDKSAGCGPPPEQKALGLGCAPNTWHWGGLSMSAASQFTLLRAADRVVSAATTTRTTFPSAAPAGSFLRFNGIGGLQVSFDGGKTWSVPQTQLESKHQPDHFENYWTPVPQGATSVLFQGQNWYGGPWFARDLAIFSQNGSSTAPPPSTPTANPTGTPGSTPTPKAPPTPTPAPTTHPRATILGGINAEPSMRPWRYSGANPDGWWCQPPNCFQNANPMTTINSELALAKKLGVANVRVEFPWALIEPQRGVFDWSRADAIVGAAKSQGVQLQPVLVFTPSWAASGATQTPAASDFATFVSAIVGRYHGSIHYWEMWNEPDHFHYWNSGEPAFVQNIVMPGYQAAKAADPASNIILAGTSVWSASWFGGVFQSGGGHSFDIVAYHDYGGSPQQTAYNVQSAEKAQGGGWPIWLGEYGVQEGSISDTQQKALMTAVLTSTAPLAMAQWYNLRDDNSMTCCPPAVMVAATWGLTMHDDITMKQGFATMQALLTGTGQVGPTPTPTPVPVPGTSSPTPTPAPTHEPSSSPTATPRTEGTPTPGPLPAPTPTAPR